MADEMNSVATENKEKPVISQVKARQKIRFVLISQGQGGANIASVLRQCLPNNPYWIAVNTSQQDLDQTGLPDEQQFVIGGKNANGAGKLRNIAKQYYNDFKMELNGKQLDALQSFVYLYEEKLFHPEIQTVIIDLFSADGGTGSGIGPKFTTFLSNYINKAASFTYGGQTFNIDEFNTVPRPVIFGLTPKCLLSGGEMNIRNTIECFVDMQIAGENGLANFFIADNNLPSSVQFKNSEEMYRIINARIAIPLMKFLGIEMNSSIKCMDLQDKINTLRIPGFSSFVSVSAENKFQYVVPRGQSCKRVIEMIRYTEDGSEERAAKQLLQNYDIMCRDVMPVFFEPEKMSIEADVVSKDLVEESMIGLFGFGSLNAVVEDLRANLHRIQESNEKKADIIKSESSGFSSVKEDASNIDAAFGVTTMSNDQLKNLF